MLRCVFVLSCQQRELCLLPAVKAQDQGKICVVIDLDETLVHSSFKVQRLLLHHIQKAQHSPAQRRQLLSCHLSSDPVLLPVDRKRFDGSVQCVLCDIAVSLVT